MDIASPQPETEPATRSPGVDAAVMLGITSMSWGCAFAYESGIAHTFGFPGSLIQVGIGEVFRAAVALLLAAGALFAMLQLVPFIWSKGRGPVGHRLSLLLISLLLFVALRAAMPSLGKVLFWSWIVVAVRILFDLIFPLLEFRKVKGYTRKVEASDRADHSIPVLADLVNHQRFSWIAWGSIGAASILALSFGLGVDHARRQVEFLIQDEPRQLAVLRVYGDRAIAAPLEPEVGRILPEFFVFSINPSVLRKVSVGPISPAAIDTLRPVSHDNTSGVSIEPAGTLENPVVVVPDSAGG